MIIYDEYEIKIGGIFSVLHSFMIFVFVCYVCLFSRFMSEYRFDVSKLEPLVAKVSDLILLLMHSFFHFF